MLSLLPVVRPESSDWFALSADVGRNRPNLREDTFRVESLLANDGDAELRGGDGPAGRWNFGLDGAIRRFQKRNALKVDGWLRPGGPTIEALRARQGDAFAGFDVPTTDEIAAHHAAIAEGSAPLIAFASPQATLAPIPDLPKLGQADRDSNTSQLDWLDAHQIGLGDVPAQFARYVELGPQGIAQARDFVQQFQRRWPGERDALVDGILDRLDPNAQESFLGTPRPAGQPFGTRIGGARKPAEPVARDLLLRKDEELPDHLTRRTLEFRKGEDEGGATPMTAANDTDDGDTSDDAANEPQEAREKRFPPNTPNIDKFFDDYTELAEKLAKELDTDPKYILSLMSLEGGWGDEGSRGKNNPFGFVKNNEKMRFEKLEDAFELFKRTRGPSVQGVKSMEEFVDKLQSSKLGLDKYNSEPPDPKTKKSYAEKLFEQYETIIRRQDNWRSRRAS